MDIVNVLSSQYLFTIRSSVYLCSCIYKHTLVLSTAGKCQIPGRGTQPDIQWEHQVFFEVTTQALFIF